MTKEQQFFDAPSPDCDALGPEEQDILQEIMNIGFGSAATDLAGVIDIHIQFSASTIAIIHSAELIGFIRKNSPDVAEISVIEQNFWSKFKGTTMLTFTVGAGRALLRLMGAENEEQTFESDPMRILEKEMLMEIGNILSGACVGKIAELLGNFVIYSPPRVLIGTFENANLSKIAGAQGNFITILQTSFNFGEQDLSGGLFLIISHDSIIWLRSALKNFLSQYK
ncbi:MAG: chemotaxis protein CheC [Syntrophorhabdaceae bacterium]|nr:chemotaxis protein CheC [Syntrophorhabdaceae bacterium]